MNVHQRNCTSSPPPKKVPFALPHHEYTPLGAAHHGSSCCVVMTAVHWWHCQVLVEVYKGAFIERFIKCIYFSIDLCLKTLGFYLKMTSFKLVLNRSLPTARVSGPIFFFNNFLEFSSWTHNEFFFLILKQELLVYSMVIRRHRSLSIFPPLFTCLEILILISF